MSEDATIQDEPQDEPQDELHDGTVATAIAPAPASTLPARTAPVLIFRVEQWISTITVEGVTPLVVKRFDEKSKSAMRTKQTGGAIRPRDPKVAKEEFERARHRLSDGSDGFPALAFKKAAVAGARSLPGITMTAARGLFFVLPDDRKTGLVRLMLQGEPVMREDAVRNADGTADLRYRPEYWPWAARLRILYSARTVTVEQIVSLLNAGGFHCGVGELRPEKSGAFNGQFRVAEERIVNERAQGAIF